MVSGKFLILFVVLIVTGSGIYFFNNSFDVTADGCLWTPVLGENDKDFSSLQELEDYMTSNFGENSIAELTNEEFRVFDDILHICSEKVSGEVAQ